MEKHMQEIRKGHHNRINKKIKKVNPNNMNNTTLMSFEENLKSINKSPNQNLYYKMDRTIYS